MPVLPKNLTEGKGAQRSHAAAHFSGHGKRLSLIMRASLLKTLMPHAVLLVVAVAVAASAQPIALNEAQKHLMSASKLYERLEYEKALDEVKKAKAAASGSADDAAIARSEGVILFDLGRRPEALVSFKRALLLEPDAHLAVRVSPKISEAYEATRVQAKSELAAIDAQRRAAEEIAKARADAATAEAARLAAEQREAKSKAEADETRRRAEEAKTQQLSDVKAREAEAAAAAAKLADAQLKLKEQTRVAQELRQAQVQAEADHRAASVDRPVEVKLVPREVLTPPPSVVARGFSPVPIVFGSVAAAAGAVAVTFGVLANQQLTSARAATFQSDTVAELNRGHTYALVSNIALGVVGTAAIATIIALVADRPPPPPPAPTEAP